MVPLVIVALMFAVQVGLAYHARQVASGAAHDGAATGARLGSSAQIGEETARALAVGSAGGLIDDLSVVGAPTGDSVTVTITGSVVKVLPIFPTFHVTATASAPLERFRPQLAEASP